MSGRRRLVAVVIHQSPVDPTEYSEPRSWIKARSTMTKAKHGSILRGLDSHNVITKPRSRGPAPLYSTKFHPMDTVLRPSQARKRGFTTAFEEKDDKTDGTYQPNQPSTPPKRRMLSKRAKDSDSRARYTFSREVMEILDNEDKVIPDSEDSGVDDETSQVVPNRFPRNHVIPDESKHSDMERSSIATSEDITIEVIPDSKDESERSDMEQSSVASAEAITKEAIPDSEEDIGYGGESENDGSDIIVHSKHTVVTGTPTAPVSEKCAASNAIPKSDTPIFEDSDMNSDMWWETRTEDLHHSGPSSFSDNDGNNIKMPSKLQVMPRKEYNGVSPVANPKTITNSIMSDHAGEEDRDDEPKGCNTREPTVYQLFTSQDGSWLSTPRNSRTLPKFMDSDNRVYEMVDTLADEMGLSGEQNMHWSGQTYQNDDSVETLRGDDPQQQFATLPSTPTNSSRKRVSFADTDAILESSPHVHDTVDIASSALMEVRYIEDLQATMSAADATSGSHPLPPVPITSPEMRSILQYDPPQHSNGHTNSDDDETDSVTGDEAGEEGRHDDGPIEPGDKLQEYHQQRRDKYRSPEPYAPSHPSSLPSVGQRKGSFKMGWTTVN
ncbi:hypothetical protein P152DRAFT_19187 [Eremomyces bilateralis CBS 781.70]|uniref:Uncharacterized protein n=1 Tax=Eremomyces bilateralis CBS 781.70 TaxID=1392243 RepID=A0A6G1GH59_9PEZI|nr:uncharacterized protein P152DRAFT_19187 [Eremomyces bilateralis CBS 781.70]KAF1817437.1 hypothetical protein P152DRAFT_19187 [Eremomyces bilateralis CBS 781.70]